MKYVLIFMLITDGVGSFSLTAEFNNKAACAVALDSIHATRRSSTEARYNGWLHAKCYPKGG